MQCRGGNVANFTGIWSARVEPRAALDAHGPCATPTEPGWYAHLAGVEATFERVGVSADDKLYCRGRQVTAMTGTWSARCDPRSAFRLEFAPPLRGALDRTLRGAHQRPYLHDVLGLADMAMRAAGIHRATLHQDGVTPPSNGDHVAMTQTLVIALAPRFAPFVSPERAVMLLAVHDILEADILNTFVRRACAAVPRSVRVDRRAAVA
jgi:hypothetical protein